MIVKSRNVVIILIIVSLFILMEITAHLLQKPNRIDLEEESPFLLKTKWHQIGDYARFVTIDEDVGCWATAIAQIAHYHQINPTGKIEYQTSEGHHISVDLNDYPFRHDLFASRLNHDTPEISKGQVAKYLYYIAALIYTDFGSSGYLEHESMVARLEKHLNCSVKFYEYKKEHYLNEREDIKNLVITEINANRPLMFYFDNGKDFGHATVIDGYTQEKNSFLVHLNMGWGGRHDGWYDLFQKTKK
ncbi:MAG: hypothetical protein GF421_10885 [Candidatus Aminicenantes bacterium]|nr:hypothetical protein [Candidatus Aminicenantes bacterium]